MRIRIGIQPKMLDPDPFKINTEPQPCRKCSKTHITWDIKYVFRFRSNVAVAETPIDKFIRYGIPVLRIRDVYPGSRFKIPIPVPNFSHPGSRIRIKEFKYCNPKKWFLSSRKYDPGCSSWIRILILSHPGSRIQGPKRHWISGSRIRNTAVRYTINWTNNIKGQGCAISILGAQRSEVYFYKAS